MLHSLGQAYVDFPDPLMVTPRVSWDLVSIAGLFSWTTYNYHYASEEGVDV